MSRLELDQDVGGVGGAGGAGSSVATLSKPLSHLLANRQWWKVCWVYGDQQKFYRQLYGRKKNLTTLRGAPAVAGVGGVDTDTDADADADAYDTVCSHSYE